MEENFDDLYKQFLQKVNEINDNYSDLRKLMRKINQRIIHEKDGQEN